MADEIENKYLFNNEGKLTFRFDDVCINEDSKLRQNITDFLFERFPECRIIYGVSPLVNDMSTEESSIARQRIFPSIIKAYADHRGFYCVDKCGIPELDYRVQLAGHGIVHVDHRLLNKQAQELSILTSCSLIDAKIFIPPFNKWNKDTEEICAEWEIELNKFEDGYLGMEHNEYNPKHKLWYLHAREWTMEKIKEWFK